MGYSITDRNGKEHKSKAKTEKRAVQILHKNGKSNAFWFKTYAAALNDRNKFPSLDIEVHKTVLTGRGFGPATHLEETMRRDQRQRTAHRLGLVALTQGYVTPETAEAVQREINASDAMIAREWQRRRNARKAKRGNDDE